MDLHVVATTISHKNRQYLLAQGFREHRVESPFIVTKLIFTFDFPIGTTLAIAKETFTVTRDYLWNQGFEGYMELELVKQSFLIDYKPYQQIIDPNTLHVYTPEPVIAQNFKEGDYHFTMYEGDQVLEDILVNTGMYFVNFYEKARLSGKLHRVITLQFKDLYQGVKMSNNVLNFIYTNGGYGGLFKEEPTIMYDRTPDYPVPPCVYLK